MFEPGKVAPDVNLIDASGTPHQLWDYRNRSHVAFAVLPFGNIESVQEWFAKAGAHQKTWDWLGVKFFGATSSAVPLDPGVYAIDRFGGFINHLPYTDDLWEKIEKEFFYYEARHC